MQSTLYKVYAALMAKRLATWAILENKMSSAQKGFLPFEGCMEHSFLMQSAIQDSKRRRDLRILWLDLQNAFGSVPHSIMWDMMARLGVPQHFLDICKDIYTGSTQQIRTESGYTNSIPVRRGIKQGCPLSPLLFNLVLEGVLPQLEQAEGYRFDNHSSVGTLAYADDIALLGATRATIQSKLDTLLTFFQWAGLTLNPSKCGALSLINSASRKYVEPFSPRINESTRIPALKWQDTYKYLGVQTGVERQPSLVSLQEEMTHDAKIILESPLTEWQKVDALNTFVISKVTYQLGATIVNRTWPAKTDSLVRKLLKRAMRFPTRTICAFFHTSTKDGGLGSGCSELLSRPTRRSGRSKLPSHPSRRSGRRELPSHPSRRSGRNELPSHPSRRSGRSELPSHPSRRSGRHAFPQPPCHR